MKIVNCPYCENIIEVVIQDQSLCFHSNCQSCKKVFYYQQGEGIKLENHKVHIFMYLSAKRTGNYVSIYNWLEEHLFDCKNYTEYFKWLNDLSVDGKQQLVKDMLNSLEEKIKNEFSRWKKAEFQQKITILKTQPIE